MFYISKYVSFTIRPSETHSHTHTRTHAHTHTHTHTCTCKVLNRAGPHEKVEYEKVESMSDRYGKEGEEKSIKYSINLLHHDLR